jgi:hypothetical protein
VLANVSEGLGVLIGVGRAGGIPGDLAGGLVETFAGGVAVAVAVAVGVCSGLVRCRLCDVEPVISIDLAPSGLFYV